MHLAFSSSYYINPQTSGATQPYGPHVIPYGEIELDGEDTHHKWYSPDIANPAYKFSNSNTKPTTQVTWSYDTKPPASSGSTTPPKSREFQIGMDLTYRDRMGRSVLVF